MDERDIVRPRLVNLARARDVAQVIDQEGARAQALGRLWFTYLRGESADPLERAPLGVDERLAELAGDAQQLVPVLVADAERQRHRDDAAQQRRPERVDELLVASQEEDQLVAAAGTETLQVIEDAERASVQLLKAHITSVVLALEVSDPAGIVAVGREQLGQSRNVRRGVRQVRHQRRSSLMCRG